MTNDKRFRKFWLAAQLFAGVSAAHAQADGSFYGVLDLSYGRFEPSGQYYENRWNSNSLSPTFVGVNAKYAFDGGWTPGITLETFIRIHDYRLGRNDDDPFLSRNAFVSLDTTDYGTLRIGRQQTYLFNSTVNFNALGNSAFSPAIRSVFGSGGLEGVQGDFYWDQAIGYLSPRIEGFSLNAMYARGSSDERGDYAGATILYSQGLFAAQASAQRVSVDDGINDPTDENTWQIGATYNFGVVKVYGLYTYMDDRGFDVRSRVGTAGVAIPIGPGSLLLQAGQTNASGPAVDRKHTLVSAAYVYEFNSLLDFYVIGQNDRISGQTDGFSIFAGARLKFSLP
jgi:predicted porin